MKFHLAYLLGQSLMKADKTWYKGGYLKFFKEIKNIKEFYKLNQKTKEFLQKENLSLLLADFLERFNSNYKVNSYELEQNLAILKDTLNLIKTHIFKEIPQSLNGFIIKHLDVIYLWLSSREFKEKYLDTKHPYPPLINPRLLNMEFESEKLENENLNLTQNENLNFNKSLNSSKGLNLNENLDPNENLKNLYKKQGLSYKNIPANLAWDMNLPLPKSLVYKRTHLGSSASIAFPNFMKECDIEECYAGDLNFYLKFYKLYLEDDNKKIAIIGYPWGDKNQWLKFASLLQEKIPFVFISRDPIEKLQHALNHIENGRIHISSEMKKFNLHSKIENLVPKMVYGYNEGKEKPDVSSIHKENNHIYSEMKALIRDVNLMKNFISEVICLDFTKLKPDYAYDSICELALKLGLSKPKDEKKFKERLNRNRGALYTLPSVLYAHHFDLSEESLYDENKSLSLEGGQSIFIGTYNHYSNACKNQNLINISLEILENEVIIDDSMICIYIEDKDYESLKNNKDLYEKSKEFLKKYVEFLAKNSEEIKENLLTERQILDYIKKDKKLAFQIKKCLEPEIKFISENFSWVMKSWGYYHEFKKICDEFKKQE